MLYFKISFPCAMFSSNPLSSFMELEKDGVYFNLQEERNTTFYDTYTSFGLPPSPVHLSKDRNIASCTQHLEMQHEQLESCGEYDDLLESVVLSSKRKTVTSNKDGHSKIYTAQGLRDRRVRLSVDVSQKFFLLQDMLGYDRASKTIEWLLTKSKKAIEELVEETKHSSNSTVGTNECDGRRKNERDMLRSEARARARHRTKQKMYNKFINNWFNTVNNDDSQHHALRSNFCGQFELPSDDHNKISGNQSLNIDCLSLPSSMLDTYQQHNLVISYGSSSSLIPYKDL